MTYGSIGDGWAAKITVLFGLILFFLGLSRLKSTLDYKGRNGVNKLIWAAIIVIIANLVSYLPIINLSLTPILYIISFIIQIAGLFTLKQSKEIGQRGRSGINYLFIAIVLNIIGSILGLTPLIGDTFKTGFALIAFLIIPFGWLKIQEAIILFTTSNNETSPFHEPKKGSTEKNTIAQKIIEREIGDYTSNSENESGNDFNFTTQQEQRPVNQQSIYQHTQETNRNPIKKANPNAELETDQRQHSVNYQKSIFQPPPDAYQPPTYQPTSVKRNGLPDYYLQHSRKRSHPKATNGNGSGHLLKIVLMVIISIVVLLLLFVGIKYVNIPALSKISLNPLKLFTKDANSTGVTGNPNSDFYIVNVEAVKSQRTAETKVEALKNSGFSAGYLWIPDYPSLSGIKSFAVYIGPFSTQYDCEVATEDYRKINPDAYGLLVSKERRRIEIYGIGNVNAITNWRENELVLPPAQKEKPSIVNAGNLNNDQNRISKNKGSLVDGANLLTSNRKIDSTDNNDKSLLITPQNEGGPGKVSFSQNDKTLFYFEKESQKGAIIINGNKYILNKCDAEGTSSRGSYKLFGNGITITALNCKYKDEGGDCFHGKCPEVIITLNGASKTIKNISIMDCLSFNLE